MKKVALLVLSGVLALPLGAAPKIVNSQFISVASGTQTIGPFTIADNMSRVNLTLKRCTSTDLLTWPDVSTVISISLEVSFNNGASWQLVSGFTAAGGIERLMGQEIPEAGIFGASLPPGTNRRGRVVTTVSNGPLVSVLTVEVN